MIDGRILKPAPSRREGRLASRPPGVDLDAGAAQAADLTAGAVSPATDSWRPPAGVAAAAMIEGGFTHDALPDLFRYLCSRRESLWWELTTLAGKFTLVFEAGTPIDAMFSPARPVGGKAGLKALGILFRQEGGRFVVHPGLPRQERRTLQLSGEQVLIELATLDDEALAPAAQSGRVVDVSAELALVGDVAPIDHRTAFRTQTKSVPLTDVLQLFSYSRLAYWINLLGPQDRPVGRLLLSANVVLRAEYGALQGPAAFSALLGNAAPGTTTTTIDVSPLAGPPPEAGSVGKLDALLMAELMAGRLNVDAPALTGPLQSASTISVSARVPASAEVSGTLAAAAGQSAEKSVLTRMLNLFPRGRTRP